jgi:low temperature requirement protein LtrA
MATPETPIAPRTNRSPSDPVAWLELFYDLVFVAAVVTFSDAVSFDSDFVNIGEVAAAFAALWLIWLATTLHANRYRDDGFVQRALVLGQMLLLTVNAIAVGDGFGAHPGLISVTYALLAADVAIMHARRATGSGDEVLLARLRTKQYAAAAAPIVVASFVGTSARVVLWVIGLVLLAWPTLGFRFGRLGALPPFDEHHFVERLGLLTIIVCGESFVKVSLLAADGSLDGIDIDVLVTMFVFVFASWWSYFDDVPKAGIRLEPARAACWLLGHLLLQLSLVGVAVGYGKLLGFEFGDTLRGDESLLVTLPLVGILLSLAMIGVCSRRVPQRGLLGVRVGGAGVAATIAILTSSFGWISADGVALVLTMVLIACAALTARCLRTTTVRAADPI